jgi:hypothetical protein
LHLRSTLEHVDNVAQEEYCLTEGWAGMGWGCWDESSAPSGIEWEDYERHKIAAGESVNASVRRLHDLPVGSLVWTRRFDGSYWLGEVVGDWEYRDRPESRALDLFNLRRCQWWSVGTEDAVPGKVVNNFRASITLNPVRDSGAVRYTRMLLAQLKGSDSPEESPEPLEVIKSLLGAEALEDLVAVFLQDRFDLLLVARGKTTPGYEYVLRARDTGRKAVCSVKSGSSPVDLDRLPEDPTVDLFAYAVSGNYVNGPREGLRIIETDQLVDFLRMRPEVLPDRIGRWLSR